MKNNIDMEKIREILKHSEYEMPLGNWILKGKIKNDSSYSKGRKFMRCGKTDQEKECAYLSKDKSFCTLISESVRQRECPVYGSGKKGDMK